jgi:hypothetical protein
MAEVNAASRRTSWVLMSYRLPREPSRPRIAVWRKLERLGVARLGDGLVALPADARTREQFDWIADEILEADGVAMVWLAQPTSATQEAEIVEAMRAARAAEYNVITSEADAGAALSDGERRWAVRRLREELRRIGRRDFFPPPERDIARSAVQTLADVSGVKASTVEEPA